MRKSNFLDTWKVAFKASQDGDYPFRTGLGKDADVGALSLSPVQREESTGERDDAVVHLRVRHPLVLAEDGLVSHT